MRGFIKIIAEKLIRMERSRHPYKIIRKSANFIFKNRYRLLNKLVPLNPSIRSFYGPHLNARMGDWTNEAAIFGFYGDAVAKVITEMPQDGVFIDIGANIGLFSLLASQQMPNGQVFSFEPNNTIFRDLIDNIKINDAINVVPLNLAIGDSSGVKKLHFDINHSGTAHITEDNKENCLYKNIVTVSVDVIDTLFSNIDGKNIYCKMDVEGYELRVLRGFKRSKIFSVIRVLIVEINDEHLQRYGNGAAELYDFLHREGFRPDIGFQPNAHYDEVFRRLI